MKQSDLIEVYRQRCRQNAYTIKDLLTQIDMLKAQVKDQASKHGAYKRAYLRCNPERLPVWKRVILNMIGA